MGVITLCLCTIIPHIYTSGKVSGLLAIGIHSSCASINSSAEGLKTKPLMGRQVKILVTSALDESYSRREHHKEWILTGWHEKTLHSWRGSSSMSCCWWALAAWALTWLTAISVQWDLKWPVFSTVVMGMAQRPWLALRRRMRNAFVRTLEEYEVRVVGRLQCPALHRGNTFSTVSFL